MSGVDAAASASRPPREAATVVLLRPIGLSGRAQPDPTPGFEVYLVRRPKRAGFMPDAYVFPGGKVDAPDANPALAVEPALAAAVREAFEECGVLLAEDVAGRPPSIPAERLAARRVSLCEGMLSFADLLASAGLRVAARGIHRWAHWITPSSEPRRFSAHFFVAVVPEGQLTTPAPGELTDELWATPSEVLERESRGEIKLPPPTYFTVHELARLGTLDTVARAARDRVVVTVMPKLVDGDGGATTILLPWDSDYAAAPGEGLPMPEAFSPPPWSRHVLENGRWWRRGGRP